MNLSNEDLALIVAGQLVIDNKGNFVYYNNAGLIHRDGGPAISVSHSVLTV